MVSVVIAAYNGNKYIVEQLSSILSQTRQPDEVIICDDCSSDSTAETVENFISANRCGNWHLYRNPQNKGYSLNFFGAIKQAKGDIIFLCDQDDVWYPDRLWVMCGIIESDKSIMMLSCGYDIIDGDGKVIAAPKGLRNVVSGKGRMSRLSVGEQIGCSVIRGCASCFRKELGRYLPERRFDNLLVGHDWLLSIIASVKGQNLIYDKVLGGYRVHGSNTSLSGGKKGPDRLNISKRIEGLKESVWALQYLLETKLEMSAGDIKSLKKQIVFENIRCDFLEKGGILKYLRLLFFLPRYCRYYRSLPGGLKIYAGDLIYRVSAKRHLSK